MNKNYLYIPGIISQDRALGLGREFDRYVTNNNISGDPQAPKSPSVYNYMPFVKLLVELIPVVSEKLGEAVLPTYSYARSYKYGEILARHRDRPACEVSLTLNLFKDVDWPIYFEEGDSSAKFELSPGDAGMYLGNETDHWRYEFTGQKYVQVFLHYVKADGKYSWAYFDRVK